jgi:hypothetical protein
MASCGERRPFLRGARREVRTVEVSILRGIALASLLGPEHFDVWALFRVALRYLDFIAQGLLRGMEVKVAAASSRHRRAITRGLTDRQIEPARKHSTSGLTTETGSEAKFKPQRIGCVKCFAHRSARSSPASISRVGMR